MTKNHYAAVQYRLRRIEEIKSTLAYMREYPYREYCGEADRLDDELSYLEKELAELAKL